VPLSKPTGPSTGNQIHDGNFQRGDKLLQCFKGGAVFSGFDAGEVGTKDIVRRSCGRRRTLSVKEMNRESCTDVTRRCSWRQDLVTADLVAAVPYDVKFADSVKQHMAARISFTPTGGRCPALFSSQAQVDIIGPYRVLPPRAFLINLAC